MNIVIWGNVECAVTIMAASIPVMRILVLSVWHRGPDQVSVQPLRDLRIISTRDKRTSDREIPPSHHQETALVDSKQHHDATFFLRVESDRRSTEGAYGIERIVTREERW